ncbi:hypothetical protein SEPCBS57363_005750 [Sporothrix epigloea]|uniref:GPI-anchored cell surface glycoprotein n=1 Tax=Sporothrix epigloea TaxID=1892477 RepID=A0ABP0DZA3_9PEZI
MSLNGLDNAAIKEAHEATVTEPGGWFLIRYASRDEVGLHDRGTGGVVEFRNAIAQYEEESPLYGFLKYRRRNVIIKYLPDNCSRLVQARVTVHFTAVCERFAPYNTTFSIADAKELKDTKLSAACSLHTASSSTSSSTSSLRRRRLMEIAEEEEEELRATKRQSTVKDDDSLGAQNDAAPHSSLLPVTLNSQLAKSPNESQFAGTVDPPSFTGLERPPSPAKSLDARSLPPQLAHLEMYSYASYAAGKPKVKLAPRPSLDVSLRPRTSAGTGTQRPVSAIPAGFRLQSKGSRKGRSDAHVKSSENLVHQINEDEVAAVNSPTFSKLVSIPAPASLSDTLDVRRPHTSSGRPTSSSGISVKSVATTATATATKHSTMTPEKARLMKAMKLREKKKKTSVLSPLPIPSVDISEAVAETTPDTSQYEEPFSNTSATSTTFAGGFDDRPDSKSGRSTSNNDMPNTSFSDSAIDVGLSAIDQGPVDNQSSGSPCVHAGSLECSELTKTLSLSGSTDEQVPALQSIDSEPNASGHDLSGDGTGDSTTPAETSGPALRENDNHCGTASAEVAGHREEAAAAHSQEKSLETALTNSKVSAEEPGSDRVTTLIEPLPEPAMLAAEETHKDFAPHSSEDTAAQMTDSSRPSTSTTSEFTADLEEETLAHSVAIPTISLPEPRDSQSTIGIETSNPASADVKRARRRALVDPIHTDLVNSHVSDVAQSDTNLSDDEQLMDELHSFTVLEAKSMTVSKSPITPMFPNTSPSKQEAAADGGNSRSLRTVSSPAQSSFLIPGDVTTSSARSASSGTACLQKTAQQNSANLLPKKSNIGSTISQRIKALEKLSGNIPGAAAEAPMRTERPTSTFFSVRKTSGRDTSRSPSIAERASSLTRNKTPSPPTSRESSPEMPKVITRDRLGPMASRLSVFENGNPPRGRPESVQVRARIIHDPMQPFFKMPDTHYDPSEPGQLHFKQSPLIIDHHKASGAATSAHPTFSSSGAADTTTESALRRETDDSDSTQPRRRSSLTIMKDFIKERRGSVMTVRSPSTDNLGASSLASPVSMVFPSKSSSRPPSVHTTHGLARRLSISSRHSTNNDRDVTTSPHTMSLSSSFLTETSGSGDEGRLPTSELGHKKTGSGSKNRASRFMRRLSSSLSTGRKTATPAISPTVTEEEEAFNTMPPSRGGSAAQRNTISYVGDVNVQFPDNLLWKRRTMCIDSQGFLVLSTSNGVSAATSSSDRPVGAIKRYHLSDFRSPYIPEMEVQELPNSVCLDFIDGSGLQVACEDRAGQLNVLRVLQEAYQNHTMFGQ